jgi:coenzyme F420-reducing hydrogenase alpha subunit
MRSLELKTNFSHLLQFGYATTAESAPTIVREMLIPESSVIDLPGGVSRPIRPAECKELKQVGEAGLDFALFTLKVFKDIVVSKKEYVDLITSDAYTHRTYYMGLVDDEGGANFYDGKVRVVRPNGAEFAKFDGRATCIT